MNDRTSPAAPDSVYRRQGDPDDSGWTMWRLGDTTRFNRQFDELLSRRDGDRAILRLQPHPGLGNVAGIMHGGAVMTFIDISMFMAITVIGNRDALSSGLTVDCNVQFVGGADLRRPVDAIVEITRETGRLLFVRGTIEQGDDMISSFMGILRKPRP